jgi:hypothetical protein
VILAFIEA